MSEPQQQDLHCLSYDYIVVGAGAAGSIVAENLSKEHTVLLLERGNAISWEYPKIKDPKFWPVVAGDESLDWGYCSVKQKQLNDRIIPIRRAKALGGCQVHNAMVYVRGGREGFDDWEAQGCKGWNYESILPYFEKVEKKLKITFGEQNEFLQALRKSCSQNGIPYNSDYNKDPDQFGFSPFQFLINSSCDQLQRETSYSAYIGNTHDSNLSVYSDVLVNRVLFDENKACIGVEFYDINSLKVEVTAIKEVILCAGSFGTPHILMLSGIGPCQHLEDFSIEVISDLPGVGSNLQDDLFVTAGFNSKQPVDPQPYGLLGAVIFWPSSLCKKHILTHEDTPTDIEASLGSGAMIGMEDMNTPNSYWLWPNIQKLKSRGTVRLQSNNILNEEGLKIDPNYLAEPEDLVRCITALQKAIAIGSAQPAMEEWYDSQLEPPIGSTEEELIKRIRETANTCDHWAGTAKMGPLTDPMAVVCPETLMVYGVTGLRIADASIIPTTVSGNTQGATMMIGEKASDIILKK